MPDIDLETPAGKTLRLRVIPKSAQQTDLPNLGENRGPHVAAVVLADDSSEAGRSITETYSNRLPFRTGWFDTVEVLLEEPDSDTEATLIEINRVLRPEGIARLELSSQEGPASRNRFAQLIQVTMRHLLIVDAGESEDRFFLVTTASDKSDQPTANLQPVKARPTFVLPRQVQQSPIPSRLLRVAVLLGESDSRKFEFEWHSIPLAVETWSDVLLLDPPALLFAASDGIGDEWLLSPEGALSALDRLLDSCRRQGIPSAYWDKGGEQDFARRIYFGAKFDFVFCTSDHVLHTFRSRLGEERTSSHAESVQPRLTNPITTGPRQGIFGFSPAFSETDSHVDPVTTAASALGIRYVEVRHSSDSPQDDSNGMKTDELQGDPRLLEVNPIEARHLPKSFAAAVIGTALDPRESERIALEIAATNTPIVASKQAALPDAVIHSALVADDQRQATQILATLLRSAELRSRSSHPAMRAVFASETTSARVDQILAKTGTGGPSAAPTLTVMVPTKRRHQIPHIFANLGRQTYEPMNVVLVLHGVNVDVGYLRETASEYGITRYEVLQVDESVLLGEVFNRGFSAADGDFIGKMDDDDFYGPHYAEDLMAAFQYADAEIVGKWAHYAYLEGSDITVLRYPQGEHTYQPSVAISTLIVKSAVFAETHFPPMPAGSGSVFLRNARARGARVYSADRFNYLYLRSGDGQKHTWAFSDPEITAKADFVCRGKNLDHIFV
jgi:hypothetical protein